MISASVGAGHDGAAREIARRLRSHGCGATESDFLHLLPPAVGPIGRSAYRALLKGAPAGWDWALGHLGQASRLGSSAAGLTALANRRLLRTVADVDAVVSTYPLASQALGTLRAAGRLNIPVYTFLTDMSVHALWVSRGVDHHLALHEVAAAQARALGARDVRVVAPAVRPECVPAGSGDDPSLSTAETARAAYRARFELPSGPLALVVAGSWGVGEIADAARDIAATGAATPVVACGRNDALRRRIERDGTGIAIGWTPDMADLIRACDVVVQNAGGLTSLEALACGVPVLTYRCLAGHGRTNADALDQAGWVPWIRDGASLGEALTGAIARHAAATPGTGLASPDVADVILSLTFPARLSQVPRLIPAKQAGLEQVSA